MEERKPYLDPDACQYPGSRFDLAKVLRKPELIDSKEWFATQSKFSGSSEFWAFLIIAPFSTIWKLATVLVLSVNTKQTLEPKCGSSILRLNVLSNGLPWN